MSQTDPISYDAQGDEGSGIHNKIVLKTKSFYPQLYKPEFTIQKMFVLFFFFLRRQVSYLKGKTWILRSMCDRDVLTSLL